MAFPGDVAGNVRYALRAFRREPAFAIGVLLTLAIAIGTNAAMFGLVSRLMFAAPPGIRDAARVGRLAVTVVQPDGESFSMSTMSFPAFQSVAAAPNAFTSAAAVVTGNVMVGRADNQVEVAAIKGSGQYFTTLGAQPAVGRFFGPPDDELPDGNPVVVLGYAYWQRQFGGDVHVIGQQLIVAGEPFVVIGVAAPGFNGSDLAPIDLYLPLTAASHALGPSWRSNPGMHVLEIVGRLRDGTTPAAAEAALTAAIRATPAGAPRDKITASLTSIAPGAATRQTPQSRIALLLSGVSLVVLLIATANVATLLMLRAAKRRRESAVRQALGAGHGQLAGYHLTESLLLAIGGGVLGVLLARTITVVVRRTLLPGIAETGNLIDAPMLYASIVAALGAGLLAGLGPLVQLKRQDLMTALRNGGGHGSSTRLRFHRLLVAMQLTLCTALLVGGGLFVHSLQRVQSQDLGFSTSQLLFITLDFQRRPRAIDRDLMHEEAARRLATVPGVKTVTPVQGIPFGPHHIPPISIPGYTIPPGVQFPIMYGTTPAYLDMMGVTLVKGRLITDADSRGAPLVVLVNETMARSAWPGQDPTGHCIKAGMVSPDLDPESPAALAALPCRMVVGIVRDSRARSLRLEGNEARLMQYYIPFAQLPEPVFPDEAMIYGLMVRTAGAPERVASAAQRAIQLNSALPLYARVQPYQELIDPQLSEWRLGALLFLVFGAIAVVIAAVGLFAVIAYLVAQRTRELGVRLALGGSRASIARLVVGDAMRLAAWGTVAGLLLALVGASFIQPLLFQTTAHDPIALGGATVTLLLVVALAAALPAWRGTRVDPITALRHDG